MNFFPLGLSGAWIKWFLLLAGLLTLVGCSKNDTRARKPTEERLYKIGKAYVQASHRLGGAPTNLEEIKPDFEGGITEDSLRSPRDGEEFVILWGVDYVNLPPGKNDIYTIGAYEKKGVDGSRWVLKFPLSVALLTEDGFRKATFPPGHKPQD